MAEIPVEVLVALERNATSLAAMSELMRTSQGRSERLEDAMIRQIAITEKLEQAIERMEEDARSGREAAVRQILAARRVSPLVGWILAAAATVIAAALAALATLKATGH